MFSIPELRSNYPKLFKVLSLAKYPLFLIYISLLLYIVFFARRRTGLVWSDDLINITPVKHTYNYLYALRHHNNFKWFLFSNVVGNIILFVPLPFFTSTIFKSKETFTLLTAGIVLSLSIEFLQFFFHVGITDIDDIILNMIGLLLGIYILKCLERSIGTKIN